MFLVLVLYSNVEINLLVLKPQHLNIAFIKIKELFQRLDSANHSKFSRR